MPDKGCLTAPVPLPALDAGLRMALALHRRAHHAASLGDGLLLFTRRRRRRERPWIPGGSWHELPWRLRREAQDPRGRTPASIPVLPAVAPARVGLAAPPPRRSAIPPSPALALSLHWPATGRIQATDHTVVLPGAILAPAQRIAAGLPAGGNNIVRVHLFDRSQNSVRLVRTPPVGRSISAARTERLPSRDSRRFERETGPVVTDAVNPAAGQRPGATVNAEGRSTEAILPSGSVVGSPSRGADGLESVEVVLHTRERVSASPRVAVAIYDRLTAEVASLRTVVEREVETRNAPAKPVDHTVTPARDSSLAMIENDQTLIVLSRRMRSLAQEERFRLGRLR